MVGWRHFWKNVKVSMFWTEQNNVMASCLMNADEISTDLHFPALKETLKHSFEQTC